MDEITPAELGQLLRKPIGKHGISVGEGMNISNVGMYDLILSKMRLKDDFRILEIGLGNGKFVYKYFEKNARVHVSAIDYSELMCKIAGDENQDLMKSGILDIRCEDMKAMSFEDNTFDELVTINTVYFWDPAECCIGEIKRVLKLGGRLYLGYRTREDMKDLAFAKDVFTLYDSEELESLFLSNGLTIISQFEYETSRLSVTGERVTTTDRCLIVEKP